MRQLRHLWLDNCESKCLLKSCNTGASLPHPNPCTERYSLIKVYFLCSLYSEGSESLNEDWNRRVWREVGVGVSIYCCPTVVHSVSSGGPWVSWTNCSVQSHSQYQYASSAEKTVPSGIELEQICQITKFGGPPVSGLKLSSTTLIAYLFSWDCSMVTSGETPEVILW